jgi:hypothetical protein
MARAKLPVKHMPTTPTPGPPRRSCSWRASAFDHSTTGLVLPVAHAENSFETHAGAMALIVLPMLISAPGTPKRCGTTAVQPSATTRSAKSSTFGVMPGISANTRTAGPSPLR